MRDGRSRHSHGESCGVGMAGGMSATPENFLSSFYLEIIGNAIAAVMVAQEKFIGWMLKVKVLHGTSLACDVEQCHSLERRNCARRADPFFHADLLKEVSESLRIEAFLMRGIAVRRNPVVRGARAAITCKNSHLTRR
jgi:hypothetical protein